MHEMSVAIEICRMAEHHVGRDNLPSLISVGLDVGDDAGLEIDNLEFCLEALLSNPPFGHGRPVINRTEGDVLRVAYLEVDDGN